jgi:hypothetical protein
MLVWYKDQKNISASKPQGVIYVETCRLYKLEEKEIKRAFSFEITNGADIQIILSATTDEEEKGWMGDIRVAKKKKLGVQTFADEM